MSDDTALTTTTVDDHRFLVALTPSDVPKAQQELKAWCATKIAALRAEQADLAESASVAKRNKWQWRTLDRHAREKGPEIAYYEKLLSAVHEGYLIVPNFDVSVMAVKVSEEADTPPWSKDRWRPSRLDPVDPDITLPVGEGKYVSAQPGHRIDYENESRDPNKREMVRYFYAEGLTAPKFPVVGVKPIILEATALAMSQKIFDQIGVVVSKRQDPVVIGTIFHPQDRYRQRRVSFFLAWWLDTRTL